MLKLIVLIILFSFESGVEAWTWKHGRFPLWQFTHFSELYLFFMCLTVENPFFCSLESTLRYRTIQKNDFPYKPTLRNIQWSKNCNIAVVSSILNNLKHYQFFKINSISSLTHDIPLLCRSHMSAHEAGREMAYQCEHSRRIYRYKQRIPYIQIEIGHSSPLHSAVKHQTGCLKHPNVAHGWSWQGNLFN